MGLEVYTAPEPGRSYVIGADPAEGNPTSDDSALTVLDRDSGEEVAALAGKFQPSTLAAHIDALGRWYNDAAVLVERNNHGHAVLLWLRDNSGLWRLPGHDGKPGWLSRHKGKAILYAAAADAFREGRTRLHSYATFTQLAGIGGSTLRAVDGEADDRADSYALACVACGLRTPEPYRGPLVCWPPPSYSPDSPPEWWGDDADGRASWRAFLVENGMDLDDDWSEHPWYDPP